MSRRGPITCCPHCGSELGIFTKSTYVNIPYCMGFSGEEQYNGGMYDGVEKITGGAIAYCQSCGRQICRMSTIEKQWGDKHETG